MEKTFKRISYLGIMLSSFALTSVSQASDFSIPFINASGLGDVYSGWATSAEDASTAFSNPAGLTFIKHQQLMFSALGIQGSTKFTGTSTTPPFLFPGQQNLTGSASSRISALMPSFFYSVPINNQWFFGFGQTTPWALGTNYADDSIVRYTATRSKIVVVDIGPSIAYQVDCKLSLGFGLDVNRLAVTLNNTLGPPLSFPDSPSQNHLYGWGYGWHAGAMYQLLPTTRIGLSYASRTVFHNTGNSEVFAPFGDFRTTAQRANSALPARVQLGIQHDIGCWTLLATAFYTQWSTFQKLTLQATAVPGGGTTSVTIPFNYHDTFDYSLGVHYKLNNQWLLRVGYQLMNTPTNTRNRSVSDPVGVANIFGLGARYIQNPCLMYDFGIAHGFFKTMPIDNVSLLTSLNGHTETQTNVAGVQVTWNIT